MSSKRKPKRLGGEFYKPVEHREPKTEYEWIRAMHLGKLHPVDRPTQVKRELFLLEVEKLEPEVKKEHGVGVLESLQRDVLLAYESGGGDLILDDWPKALQAHHAGTLSGYCRELLAWQHRWNLVAPWVKDAAIDTIGGWIAGWDGPWDYRGNALEWQMHLGDPGGVWGSDTITTKELIRGAPKYFAYDPFSMSRADAEAKFAAWQETQARRFTAFLDAQNKRAKTAGGERTKTTLQHVQFEWLARAHALGWTNERIADHHNERDDVDPERINTTHRVKESNRVLRGKLGLPRVSRKDR